MILQQEDPTQKIKPTKEDQIEEKTANKVTPSNERTRV